MTDEIERYGVLLVDDDPFQIKVLSHQLNTLGRAGIAACLTGRDALAYLDTWNGGELLILLDLNMPEMDGVEFVRRLVERRYSGALALMSGEDTRILEATVKLARARGLDVLGQLDKPVEPSALAALLDHWQTHIKVAPRTRRRTYGPAEIRRAIEGNELFNLYQPKVRFSTGALAGVETLVRWRHPTDGLVYPDQFIAAAEKYGLIDKLTRVVLAHAAEQAGHWNSGDRPLHVSVNVSMDNLNTLDFPELVMSKLADNDIAPECLILEVTESRLMEDPLTPLDILTRLRLKQVSLSIDDFGTGHSSLAQLRDIPFDELKIDRSFVHGAESNATLRTIFEASLAMARQLGMNVVAEGVEDRSDWDFLRVRGCDLAQGYFIAKPMPANDLCGWLREWEARCPDLTP